MVHPALDRLTFLLEPEGVRLHWITDGDNEWTGLKPGNSVADPSLRQGTDKLPLQPRAWNAARVAIVKGRGGAFAERGRGRPPRARAGEFAASSASSTSATAPRCRPATLC